MLPVEEGVAFHDALDVEQPVAALVGVRKAAADLVAVDGTIDDDVADVDTLGTVFLGHRLGERAQARLGGIEGAP